jgi:hypothetical protein
MPFRNGGSRAFTAVSIRNNVPAAPGVYGLSNARSWIYVGSSDNLQLQLLNHLREANSPIQSQNPTGFTFELCDTSGTAGRRAQLISELRPTVGMRI